MKRILFLFLVINFAGFAVYAEPANLIEVFRQAQLSDPTYKKAEATYLSEKSMLAQSRAALLPTLSLNSNWSRTNTKNNIDYGYSSATSKENPTTFRKNDLDTTISLTQSLFNWHYIKNYQKVKLDVKVATTNFAIAAEDLIMRTAKAYFTVLSEEDLVQYSAAYKRRSYRNYQVTNQRYKAGLTTLADVYGAKADYNQALATYFANKNLLSDSKEALRRITGRLYSSLANFKEKFPLIKPKPANIHFWENLAERQNLKLMASQYSVEAAQEYVKVQFAQRLPDLALMGSYEIDNAQNAHTKGHSLVKTTSYGLQLNVPIYNSGLYIAEVKTAKYDLQKATAVKDQVYRSVVASVRQAYLSVNYAISKLYADQQAIKSARSSLASNEAGYKVGTQTILDVLTAQSRLYKNEQTYTADRFNYVMDYFKLKRTSGSLTINDLAIINKSLLHITN